MESEIMINIMRKILTEIENFCKILLKTRNARRLKYQGSQTGIIHILGTGPSLSQSTEKFLNDKTAIYFAVNDFANSELFFELKPSYYILVDNAYWQAAERCSSRDLDLRTKMFSNIRQADWNMTLIIPSDVYSSGYFQRIFSNMNISFLPIVRTNIKYTGSDIFFKYLKKNLGGYFNNVLACAIYSSINMGFKKIYIYGAEHSWTKDIRVDANNQVCTIKRHFFETDGELIPWLDSQGKPFTMDVILFSLAKTFNAYRILGEYASRMGVEIVNFTPNSFIDVFKRSI